MTGFDLRTSIEGIKEMMAREKIDQSRVMLSQGDVFNMPYEANSFDLLVCISVLEHFADPRPAVEAMARVVRPGGAMAFGFPAETPFTASLFRALGYEPKDLHPASHTLILESIRAVLPIDEAHIFPLRAFPMYVACRVVKPK